MDIQLPNRKDDIYKEIESFEDYEYTNCIAFHMGMRNKEVIRIRGLLNRILYFKHRKMANKVLKKGINFEDLEIKYPSIFKFDEIQKDLEYKLKTKYFFHHQYHQLKSNDNKKLIQYDFMDELMQKREMKIKGDDSYIKPKYNFIVSDGYIIKQKLKSDLTETGTEIKALIETNFKRQLLLPIGIYNQISININPNLPKDELIAYISKIKDDFDEDNSIIKTPLELLGKDLKKVENSKINKMLIADKFFIYDYVTARKKQINKSNEFNNEVYEEEREEIKNNPYLTREDKQIQLKNLKKDFKADTSIRKDELFEDIEDFPKGTAKRYYYDIKPFIDDCEYKELITGCKLN